MHRKYFPIMFFRNPAGHEPVRDWIKSLPSQERKIIGNDLMTVQFGWPLGMSLIKKIEPGLWEVRSRLTNKHVRIIFTVFGEYIVLLHVLIKKSQKLPAEDLQISRSRLRDIKGEMNEK